MLDGPGKKRLARYLLPLSWLVASGIFFLILGMAGCTQISLPTIPGPQATLSATVTASHPSPEATLTPTALPTVTSTHIGTEISGTVPVWQTYAGPTITAATAIPPPLTDLDIPSEVQVALLAGLDQDQPYVGRTMALSLLIYNARLSKASLLTIPGDLYVYIPGYTMQRINVAFSVGGLEMLFQTLQYNFGLRPVHWVLTHPSDFTNLVDDLNGLDVPVLVPLPSVCGGITEGVMHMNGSLSLCYIRYRQSSADFEADQRQQLFLRLIFLRVVEGGNLVRLPALYQNMQKTIETDLTLMELTSYIPLALKLGDPQRVSYFDIGWNDVIPWQIPGKAQASVLLPRQAALQALIQQAIHAVMTPAPLTDRVSTLVHELTISPTTTITVPATQTPLPPATLTYTPTITRTITLTPTVTMTHTPGPSPTETLTHTPGPSPTDTLTPTEGPSPTETLTPTPSSTSTMTATP